MAEQLIPGGDSIGVVSMLSSKKQKKTRVGDELQMSAREPISSYQEIGQTSMPPTARHSIEIHTLEDHDPSQEFQDNANHQIVFSTSIQDLNRKEDEL